MGYFVAGTILIIVTAIGALVIGTWAPHLRGYWIFIPLFIGFILQGIGFYVNRPRGPKWPHQF